MNNKLICIQNVRFIFSFFRKRERYPRENIPLKSIINKNKTTHQSVRDLESSLSYRLLRIAGMIETLQSVHDEWITIEKKYKIIMETENFDFNDALEILKDKGFTDDEYILQIEYERKWGML